MKKLIITEFITLDGIAEAPGGEPGHPHTGWAGEIQSPEQTEFKRDEVFEAGSLLIGRVTYESFAGAWPTYTGPFADRMNAMPKHVVSSTLRDPEWTNSAVISGDVVQEVTRLKAEDGPPILVAGSLSLVQTLLEHDLVDEVRLMVYPVILGSGRRLFPQSPRKVPLRLAENRALDNGVMMHTYQVVSI